MANSSVLDQISVAAPCSAQWDQMSGDERARHCHFCKKNVYNLSEMSREEAEALIRKREGNLCVRFYRRADGTVMTQNCPVGLRAIRKRLRWIAGGVAAMLTFGAFKIFHNRAQAAGGLINVEPFATLMSFQPLRAIFNAFNPPPAVVGQLYAGPRRIPPPPTGPVFAAPALAAMPVPLVAAGPFPAVNKDSSPLSVVQISNNGRFAFAYIQICNKNQNSRKIMGVRVFFHDKDHAAVIRENDIIVVPFEEFSEEAEDPMAADEASILTLGSHSVDGHSALRLVAVAKHDRAQDCEEVYVSVLFEDYAKLTYLGPANTGTVSDDEQAIRPRDPQREVGLDERLRVRFVLPALPSQ